MVLAQATSPRPLLHTLCCRVKFRTSSLACSLESGTLSSPSGFGPSSCLLSLAIAMSLRSSCVNSMCSRLSTTWGKACFSQVSCSTSSSTVGSSIIFNTFTHGWCGSRPQGGALEHRPRPRPNLFCWYWKAVSHMAFISASLSPMDKKFQTCLLSRSACHGT